MMWRRWSVAACLAAIAVCAVLAGPPSSAAAVVPVIESTPTISADIPSRIITSALTTSEPAPPKITATAAFMIDAKTGEYLFSRNANARLPMASTTKIMTAILALESLDLDAKVKVSNKAVSTIGSKASLVGGETLTVEQLLYALMVVSGNDASIALAEAVSGDVDTFVERMNAKAKKLGLTNTHFMNPCGLNNKKHFSSAKDLAFLAQYALRDPMFARIVDTIDFSLPPIPPVPPGTQETLRKFDNQNELLKQMDWATGVKTGSTPYAKYCLVASGAREGVSLIAVVLGAETDSVRWKEARALLNYGLSLYPRTVLATTGEVVAEVNVNDPIGRRVRLVTAGPLIARLGRDDTVRSMVSLDRGPALPVRAGEVFGRMDFVLDSAIIGSVDLIAAQPLEKPTIAQILNHWRTRGPFYQKLFD